MEALLAALSKGARSSARLPIGIAAAFALAVAGVGVARNVSEAEVDVVTAAVDLREGQTVSPQQMVVRSVPKRLVTTSVVKPDGIPYIVNHELMFPVQAGDMLLWSHFERLPASEKAKPPP